MQPNALIIMVDQLNGTLFPDGLADWLHAPDRAPFMSGRLPSRSRVYGNAAEFCPDIPTYAHHLRRTGYYPWDYQPQQKASGYYMHNHTDLNEVEENQRFPRGE